jgi:hypothetical protein
MTAKRTLRALLPWLMLVVIGLASAWLRYRFIEPAALAHMCDEGNAHIPASCGFRHAVVIGFNTYSFGIAALVVTAAALVSKNRFIAWLAAALGLFAVIIYCYYAGAVALLIGCLRFVRLQVNGMPTPVDPYRHRDRNVQTQP